MSARKKARYERRAASRETKRAAKLSRYDNFDNITDADNLYRAFKRSMRGVAWKESTQRYEASALRNVIETRRKLLTGERVQSGFVEFTLSERGKTRLLKSIHISERVVQKALSDYVLSPILTNCLIYDNGASVKNKGVHFALRRLIMHLSKFYRANGFTNTGYALLIDFSKYFDNIDHETLFKLQNAYIKDERVRKLLYKFISVFGKGKSLGLGSQVSQISAIFYANKLDHFIKEILRIKYYGRYMDDLYVIHADKAYLQLCLLKISEMCTALKLTINTKKTRIVKLSDGVPFLKGRYILKETGRILRLPHPDSAHRMRRKLKKFKKLIAANKMNFYDLRTAYQSWRGNFAKRFDAAKAVRRMDELFYRLFLSQGETHGKNGVSGTEK